MIGVKLFGFGIELARRIAVQAFLVAVPGPVFDHCADVQVHPQRGGHVPRIGAELHLRQTQRRFSGNVEQSGEQRVKIGCDLGRRGTVVDGGRRADCIGAGGGGFLLRHGAAGKRFDSLHPAGKQDRPGQAQGQQVPAVAQQQEGQVRLRAARRQQMQPHNAAVRPAQRDLAGGGEMTAQELRFRTAQKRHIGHSQEGILWGKCRASCRGGHCPPARFTAQRASPGGIHPAPTHEGKAHCRPCRFATALPAICRGRILPARGGSRRGGVAGTAEPIYAVIIPQNPPLVYSGGILYSSAARAGSR